jgi:hypothetical protein
LTFAYQSDIPTTSTLFTFTFNGITTIAGCQVATWNSQQNTNGSGVAYLGEDLCSVSGLVVTVQLGAAYYVAGTNVVDVGSPPSLKVLVWAKAGVGLNSIVSETLLAAGQSKGTTSLSVSLVSAYLSPVFPIKVYLTANPLTIIRKADTNADVTFTFNVPTGTPLLMNSGSLAIVLVTGTVSQTSLPLSLDSLLRYNLLGQFLYPNRGICWRHSNSLRSRWD